VLPDSTDELVMVRPLGGTEDEVTGILTKLEEVGPAIFQPPDPAQVGDDRSARLLRDALRLGFRSSAGPFRSFGNIGVEPRPYQLVPLLMALRLDPVRLLISDDVGIGKTIEAALIARELLDQGDAQRLAVLCPPHLAEQWRDELRDKFHIDAELVLPSTASRLERDCKIGQSLFELHPLVIISMDFIKSERRRTEFLRTCPELVIVDEAHTCAFDPALGSRHQRHQLIAELAADPKRHMIFVTATPHSGKEEAFRSLLAFLDPDFARLSDDLSGAQNVTDRRRVAGHFIQRRRADIRQYLDATTMFPDRQEAEETYKLTPEYKRLFERVLDYARESITDTSGGQHRQRVRWWSALALLRSMASSPAAAAATLRARASTADTDDAAEADAIGETTVLDVAGSGDEENLDITPGSDYDEPSQESRTRNRLREMAREADKLKGAADAKLTKATAIVQKLLADGFNPIVFCRFIPTAEYVAEQLRTKLKDEVEVSAVTGTLPPEARKARVTELAKAGKRVLVATDCLSEGINLQDGFDAVLHYDLSWNPTRHEQREGRVDRYGQGSRNVRVVTYYGVDNQIDGIVLEVLLRKHQRIRKSLGISVPVPGNANTVVEAILEGLILRRDRGAGLEQLVLFEDELQPKEKQLLAEWEIAADREKRSRTMFSQELIKVEEVARELAAVQSAVGSGADVRRFVSTAIEAFGGRFVGDGVATAYVAETPLALREAIGVTDTFRATFESNGTAGPIHLSRTHPLVEGLASYVLTTALDPVLPSPARRCGAIRTVEVKRRTTVLLVRYRFHLMTQQGDTERAQLAEECSLLAFEGAPDSPVWLDPEIGERLLWASPSSNLSRAAASNFVAEVVESLPRLSEHINEDAQRSAVQLLRTHRRVRHDAGASGMRFKVQPKLPADVLGVYVYVPEPGATP
jgi:superfamily II DNA or RNA helicase